MLPVAIAVVVAVAAAALAVRLVRREQARNRRIDTLATELERDHARLAELPVAQERERIARELRDVVASGLEEIAAQTDGATRATAERTLAELRRLLAVLGSDEPETDPEPGLARLPELVRRARAAGMPVTLHLDGTPRPLPASVDLSAFRIVQEALTNVHKHARGAPATVRVTWRLQSVALQVRDTGTGRRVERNADGHGLVGMHQRAKLHGGELHAGALPGGGFEVSVRLPL